MAVNDFVTWAAGTGANTNDPATYAANATRQQGAQAGVASSLLFNTAMRQASTIAAVVAQFTANNQPGHVVDDGNVATLTAQLTAALTNLTSALVPDSRFFVGTDGGSADNLQVASVYPPITAYLPHCLYMIFVAANNVTTTPTLQIGALAAKAIRRADGTLAKPYDLLAGEWVMLADAGSFFEIVGLTTDSVPSSNSQAYFATSVFTVPVGVHRVKRARIWGAGGGGGAAFGTNQSSCGGGGAAYCEGFDLSCNPGDLISVYIGAGGSGGTGAGAGYGGAGGDSSFLGMLAHGGQGGSPNGLDVPGVGGTATGGDIRLSGRTAGLAFALGGDACGGLGGQAPFSSGIPGINAGGPGNLGIFPGGGANGGSSNSFTGPGTFVGGDGANGFAILEW